MSCRRPPVLAFALALAFMTSAAGAAVTTLRVVVQLLFPTG